MKNQRTLIISVFIVASCGLAYELIIAALASYLLGDSILQFSSIIGLYLFSMGIGAHLTRYIKDEDALTRFIEIELLVGIIGGLSALALFVAFGLAAAPFRSLLYAFVLITGIIVGMEIPLVMRVLHREQAAFADLVARVLTFDYLGALAVSLLFPLLLAPHLGMARSALLFGILNAAVALLTHYRLTPDAPSVLQGSLSATLITAASGSAILLTAAHGDRENRADWERNLLAATFLATILITLALPLLFLPFAWAAAIWLLEASAVYHLGLRLAHPTARQAGLALAALALLILITTYRLTPYGETLLQGSLGITFIIAACGSANILGWWQNAREPVPPWETIGQRGSAIAAYSAALSTELACPQPRTFSYHGYAPQQHPQPRALTVRLRSGEARHAVFAGLFPAPIPRGVPVLGRALFHCREFRIDAIPDGTYYLLACEIPRSRNPLRYFRLDHCLRALHPAPITFPLPAATHIDLALRPFAASDPPITVNLPKLLYDFLRQRNP